jgi:hypothetical protein
VKDGIFTRVWLYAAKKLKSREIYHFYHYLRAEKQKFAGKNFQRVG